MPQSVDEFLNSLEAKPSDDDFLNSLENRPTKWSRFGTQALARTADISDFLESGYAAPFLPSAYLGEKIGEALGLGPEPEEAPKAQWQAERAALPEAQGFGEKASDFIGNVAPDVALGVATAPVAAAGAAGAAARGVASPFARMLAGEALQSAALAPIEFGTREPVSAAISTVAGPVIGTAIGRGISRLFGRALKDAAAPQFAGPTNVTAEEVLQQRGLVPPATPAIETTVGEFAPAAATRAQERIQQALIEGKPVRTSDLMELGDKEIADSAHDAFSTMLRQSLEAVSKSGADEATLKQAAQDLAETGQRLPPKINQEIADAVDSLPPKAAARLAVSLKAKGVCPI